MMFDPTRYRVHDLTLTFSDEISDYEDSQARDLQTDGWNAKWLKIYSHAGTHVDAPIHFGVSSQTIDQYEPIDLIGRAWIADIDIVKDQQLLGIEDLGEVYTRVERGDSLILKTGWSEHVGLEKYRMKLPRISPELAGWCVQTGLKMLGVEAPSVADVNNLEEVTQIHQILMSGEVIIIEGLCHLNRISANQVFLVAMPLKIGNGDGAPARVIAFEEKVENRKA